MLKQVKMYVYLLLCIGLTIPAYASNYYVDKDAGGSNNGSSWTNAWESFSDINWSVIGPGDIVYISGGPSGKTYTSGLSIGASGTSGSPVTITKGIDANHNGNVILSGSGGTGITLNNHHDVVISNLMLNGWGTAVSLDGGTSNATYNIVLDNLDGEMAGRYVHIEGYPDVTGSYCHDITIRNCDVTTVTDVNDQTDFIYAQYMKGLIIEDNHVVISNENPSPHCDAIQTYYVDGPVIVRNNYFEHADHKTRNSQGIFFENHEGDYYVYNNIVVMPNSLDGKIYWKSSSVNNAHTYIYSNTIYGLSGNLIETTDPNAVIKNNILYSTGYQSNGSTYMLIFNGVSGNNAQVSNNLFYDPAGNMNNMNSGSNQNGVDGNPIFTNINGRNFTVQSGSPAVDMGTNLGNSYNVDMVGTSRPQGQSYDAGAYEKVTGGGGNTPPVQAANPSPSNGAQNQGINTTLSWNCSDPNGDPLTYNVYFGTSVNPPVVSNGQTAKNYNPGQLQNNTTYYWKIVANDGQGGTSTSPVWSFSTIGSTNDPPNQAANPSPSNGAQNQGINTTLSWNCSDPNGDPLTYNVYFGTSVNPPVVSNGQTAKNYSPGQLQNNTTYYWKIVADDGQGGTSTSPVWSFSTEANVGDTTSPELSSVDLVGMSNVVIYFSEEMDPVSISNPSNYSISPEITIQKLSVYPGNTKVVLRTNSHTPGTNYKLTVQNVKDLAGNLISPEHNSSSYIAKDKVKRQIVNANGAWSQNYEPSRSIDGNADTTSESRWITSASDSITFDLGSSSSIEETRISFYRWNYDRIYNYSVLTSTDNANWTEVVSNQNSGLEEWTVDGFSAIEARYVKLVIWSSNEPGPKGLWEAEIYGSESITGTNEDPVSPDNFTLEQNYPNPFNPTTTIKFSVPSDQMVKINVYNSIGQLVNQLVNQTYSAGSHSVTFDASNLPSGVYVYRIDAGKFTNTKKMVLMK